MKKVLMGLFVSLLTVAFVSCNKKDEVLNVTADQLVGTWEMTKIVETTSEGGRTFSYVWEGEELRNEFGEEMYIRLDEDGKAYVGASISTLSYSSTWSVSGNQMKMGHDDETTSMTIGSISANAFTLVESYSEDGYSESSAIYFTRVE